MSTSKIIDNKISYEYEEDIIKQLKGICAIIDGLEYGSEEGSHKYLVDGLGIVNNLLFETINKAQKYQNIIANLANKNNITNVEINIGA